MARLDGRLSGFFKSNRASDAPFVLEDATGAVLASVTVDQQLAPDSFADQLFSWGDLATVNLSGGTLIVKLSESPGATGQVIADAIRIVRVGDLAGSSLAGNAAQATDAALIEDPLEEVFEELAGDWQQALEGDGH